MESGLHFPTWEHTGGEDAFSLWLKIWTGKCQSSWSTEDTFHLRSQPTTTVNRERGVAEVEGGEERKEERKTWTVEGIVWQKDTETLTVKVTEDGNPGKT